jgi:hypothetical protein
MDRWFWSTLRNGLVTRHRVGSTSKMRNENCSSNDSEYRRVHRVMIIIMDDELLPIHNASHHLVKRICNGYFDVAGNCARQLGYESIRGGYAKSVGLSKWMA